MSEGNKLKYPIRKLPETRDNQSEDALSLEGLSKLTSGFGKGIAKRKMLVTKRVSVKALSEMSKEEKI